MDDHAVQPRRRGRPSTSESAARSVDDTSPVELLPVRSAIAPPSDAEIVRERAVDDSMAGGSAKAATQKRVSQNVVADTFRNDLPSPRS